jgi:hypothetical protein
MKILIFSVFKEFEYLLEGQVGLDILVQWFETVVERCVTTAARERGCPVRRVAHHFLLIWVTVGARVLRDLTLTSTNSFGESCKVIKLTRIMSLHTLCSRHIWIHSQRGRKWDSNSPCVMNTTHSWKTIHISIIHNFISIFPYTQCHKKWFIYFIAKSRERHVEKSALNPVSQKLT